MLLCRRPRLAWNLFQLSAWAAAGWLTVDARAAAPQRRGVTPLGVLTETPTAAPAKPLTPTNASTNSPAAAAGAEYRLHVGDRLLFRIAEDPVKSQESEAFAINALGEVHFPISKSASTRLTVLVRGKTLDELRAEVKRLLDRDYYYNATIEMRLQDRILHPGQVLIYGRGVRGGSLVIPPGEQKTLLEAILQSGPTEFANLRKVRLHRLDATTQETVTQVVDMEQVKRTGSRTKDIVLQDGDRIEVPEKGVVF